MCIPIYSGFSYLLFIYMLHRSNSLASFLDGQLTVFDDFYVENRLKYKYWLPIS